MSIKLFLGYKLLYSEIKHNCIFIINLKKSKWYTLFKSYKSWRLRTQWKYHFITWAWSYYTGHWSVIYVITWQFLHGRRGYIKILQYPNKKQEKLFVSQSLAWTISLSHWKCNHVIVVLVVSTRVYKSFRLETMGVRKVIFVIHHVYQTGKYSCSFWNNEIAHWNGSPCTMWKAKGRKRHNSEAFQRKCICVMHFIFVSKPRTSVSTNNLFKKLNDTHR